MLRKLRNRRRQAVKRRLEINLDGFEFGLSPEEVIADPQLRCWSNHGDRPIGAGRPT